MSRTRQGRRTKGADNYPTPQWAIERFLEEWEDLPNVGNRWLEPAVGDGVIVETVNGYRSGIDWTCCDIRDTRPALRRIGLNGEVKVGDFFTLPMFKAPESPLIKPFDVAIMNPPFRFTMDFIIRCLQLADVVVMMQRINYCGSAERNSYFRQNMPDLYVIPDRISFTGNGKADSVENAWHVWGPHPIVSCGEIRMLATTTLEERKRANRRIVRARDELTITLDALFQEATGEPCTSQIAL